MTNGNRLLLIAFVVAVISAGVYLYSKDSNIVAPKNQVKARPTTENKTALPTSQAPALAPTRSPASANYVNTPSPVWKEHLISSLKEQAGDSLKDVQVKKERSLIWNYDSVPLSAEAVVVTVKNHQGEVTSFRAIVDSQTGRILESWDRPISDPADVRAGFHIKLDERYSN